jgi:hypothetical protein
MLVYPISDQTLINRRLNNRMYDSFEVLIVLHSNELL